MVLLHNLMILIESSSQPCALLVLSLRISFNISVSSIAILKSVQSALSDLLTTSATHGTFSRPSRKRGLISIIKLMQFTIVRFF